MEPDYAILSAVIAAIYDAAIDPTRWTQALRCACDFVGGAQAVMFWQGHAADEVEALHLYNQDPLYTRMFLEKLAPLNPVFPAALFQDVGAVHTTTDLIPADELQQTQFYKEWVAPQGLADAVAVMLEKDATRVTLLSFPTTGRIDDTTRRRLAMLVPHFQRAVAIGRTFARSRSDAAAFTETLDQIGDGVFLVAEDGGIVFANAVGRRIGEEGELLRVERNKLRVNDPNADRLLRDGLRTVAKGDGDQRARGATIALSDTGDRQWTANILPLRDGARRLVGHKTHAAAAVFVRGARFADPTPLETLAKRHQLTASEVRVVDAMLRVSGLDAIADALGISRATVKTHLNRIFRKTAARNQSDLIKLIAGLGRGAQTSRTPD